MDSHIVLAVVGKLVRGYRGGVHGDFREDGVTYVDVEFPDMVRATCCADIMSARNPVSEFEALNPRMAVHADLAPGAEVKSIHDVVTLRFTLSDRWIAHVIENNPSE